MIHRRYKDFLGHGNRPADRRGRGIVLEAAADPEGAPQGEGSTSKSVDAQAVEEDRKPFVFDSKIQLGDKLSRYPVEVLKNEPMFFNCTWTYAYENGGEPTREFLMALPEELHNDRTIVDSRCHMLMPGWYPCIPGFHHDDVSRDTRSGQPNYFTPSYRSKHALVLFNGDVCPTEFAIGTAEFPRVAEGEVYYKVWHPIVEEKIKAGELERVKAPSDQVVFFDDRSWHQGTKAVKNGWRLFIRASWDTGRKPTNEIRQQVQVYMDNPMEGW